MSSVTRPAPPDQSQREQALDASRSILVQAPAGSGKTDLLTRRFLRLLGEVEDPGQIVAITFTKAAAAEMRNRILAELEKAADYPGPKSGDPSTGSGQALGRPAEDDEFSMESLARRALERSRALGWDVVRMPAQLRISTIDSFSRDLALQQPLLSGLGGAMDITENAGDLYRRAARRTLEQVGDADGDLRTPELSPAIEKLLLWRDNGWQDMEDLLVNMLEKRDQWMQEFLVARNPDWGALRARLEGPFARAVDEALTELDQLLDQEMRDEAMDLARFACGEKNKWKQCKLFQIAGQPCQPFAGPDELDRARQGYICIADFLLTKTAGTLRKFITLESAEEQQRARDLVQRLRNIPGLAEKLHSIRDLPPAQYPEEDWQVVKACFTLLRHAAGQLKVTFAEAGVVDFVEVSQVALGVLGGEDGTPSDAAMAVADGIHHLLVDEFQDTSRRQHRLIGALVGAWPDQVGRSVFVVGDPMQSIYFFRDADAELFARVRRLGLELPDRSTLPLDFVALESNFRTAPPLVRELNDTFKLVFAANDGSRIGFTKALAAREEDGDRGPRRQLHLKFMPQTVSARSTDRDKMRRKEEAAESRTAAHEAQTAEIVDLIRGLMERCEAARAGRKKFRIAVLGRARKSLEPIAAALREAGIPFRAVDLESLCDRPEVLDALALARALFYREDRVAWLGVLRAPWCGLSLSDLHALTSGDDANLLRRPVAELLAERIGLLSGDGQIAAGRLMRVMADAQAMRAAEPGASLGTWLEQVWMRLGGAACVDATGRANLDLLWKCLDHLEEGEPDLLGRGLDAALAKLMAQPDPGASSDNGVQLMSIHKSKGLEFEVVIVPELQAGCGRGERRLLSWQERGVEPGGDSDEVTEFLVAPLQSKGADRGPCRKWVDGVRATRESQETRRILYVAATRAREELHLFARPEYKTENDGSYSLCNPRGSLLETAWPALSAEIRGRFEDWMKAPEDLEVASMAAGADNVIMMPRPAKPARVRRLPADYQAPVLGTEPGGEEAQSAGAAGVQLYARHVGGALSRGLGNAVHALLEELAGLRASHPMESARRELAEMLPRITAQLRSAGLDQEQAAKIAASAMEIVVKASRDSDGEWILSPHEGAASEVRWAGVIGGRLREVRVDRVFRAGKAPRDEGGECWWIIDYKTANEGADDLVKLRGMFAGQLETYATVLRNLHGKDAAIRAGLYYPRMAALDWWEL